MAPQPRARQTEVLYVRISRETYAAIKAEAARRGWPHTIASVADAALAKAFDKERP